MGGGLKGTPARTLLFLSFHPQIQYVKPQSCEMFGYQNNAIRNIPRGQASRFSFLFFSPAWREKKMAEYKKSHLKLNLEKVKISLLE